MAIKQAVLWFPGLSILSEGFKSRPFAGRRWVPSIQDVLPELPQCLWIPFALWKFPPLLLTLLPLLFEPTNANIKIYSLRCTSPHFWRDGPALGQFHGGFMRNPWGLLENCRISGTNTARKEFSPILHKSSVLVRSLTRLNQSASQRRPAPYASSLAKDPGFVQIEGQENRRSLQKKWKPQRLRQLPHLKQPCLKESRLW